eukprot:COSAG05_NODE_2593_length_2862_cov_1.878393_1_plen_941_part_10
MLNLRLSKDQLQSLSKALDVDSDGELTVVEAAEMFPDTTRGLGELIHDMLQADTGVKEPQAPARNRHFTGREDILSRLHQSVSRANKPIAIYAEPGAGKTSVLVELVWREHIEERTHWCGRIVFVDVAGLREESALKRKIAVGLGGEGVQDQELSQILSKGKEDHPRLLLLDNVRQNAAIEPVLQEIASSSPSTRLVLASSAALTIDEVENTALERLGEADARQLLLKLTPGAQGSLIDQMNPLLSLLLPLDIARVAPEIIDAETEVEQSQLMNRLRARYGADGATESMKVDAAPAVWTPNDQALLRICLAVPEGATFDAEAAGAFVDDDNERKSDQESQHTAATQPTQTFKFKKTGVLGIEWQVLEDYAGGAILTVKGVVGGGHAANNNVKVGMGLLSINGAKKAPGTSIRQFKDQLDSSVDRPLVLELVSPTQPWRPFGTWLRVQNERRGAKLIRTLQRQRMLEEPTRGRFRVSTTVIAEQKQSTRTTATTAEALERHAKHYLGRLPWIAKLYASKEQRVALRMCAIDRPNFEAALLIGQDADVSLPPQLLESHLLVTLGLSDGAVLKSCVELLQTELSDEDLLTYLRRLQLAVDIRDSAVTSTSSPSTDSLNMDLYVSTWTYEKISESVQEDKGDGKTYAAREEALRPHRYQLMRKFRKILAIGEERYGAASIHDLVLDPIQQMADMISDRAGEDDFDEKNDDSDGVDGNSNDDDNDDDDDSGDDSDDDDDSGDDSDDDSDDDDDEKTEAAQRKALALLRRMMANEEANLGPGHMEVYGSLGQIADLLEELGEKEQALKLYYKVLSVTETRMGPEHTDVAFALGSIIVYLESNDVEDTKPLKEALALRRRCEQIFTTAHGTTARGTVELKEAADHAEERIRKIEAGLLNLQSPWKKNTNPDTGQFYYYTDDGTFQLEPPEEGVEREYEESGADFAESY